MPPALKDLTPALVLAAVTSVVGFLVSYGLITNSTEQLTAAIASAAIPAAFLLIKSVVGWRHATVASAVAVVVAVVGFVVQAGFIDSAHAKLLIGLASTVIPVVGILIHGIAGYVSPAVPSRGGAGPPLPAGE